MDLFIWISVLSVSINFYQVFNFMLCCYCHLVVRRQSVGWLCPTLADQISSESYTAVYRLLESPCYIVALLCNSGRGNQISDKLKWFNGTWRVAVGQLNNRTLWDKVLLNNSMSASVFGFQVRRWPNPTGQQFRPRSLTLATSLTEVLHGESGSEI